MGITISYMGTKRKLGPVVKRVLHNLPDGPILDAFAGMSAIGQAVSTDRPIWVNDVQPFPASAGRFLFCSKSCHLNSVEALRILASFFSRNMKFIKRKYPDFLELEDKYLESKSLVSIIAGNIKLPYVGNSAKLERIRSKHAMEKGAFPYEMATITYAGSFFGARQCMEIDSLRYAIDQALLRGLIDLEQKMGIMVALGQAMSRVNNSTGHFAQFLKPSQNNIELIINKRRKSVLNEFLLALDSISPIGNKNWRKQNKAFCSDAIPLLKKISSQKVRPMIIYADPPYSDAQYSRYYHVLDQILGYNYAKVTGLGRYPEGRFQSGFAQSGKVSECMTILAGLASIMGVHFLLSYPDNGLYCQKGGDIFKLLRTSFRHVNIIHTENTRHSAFGGPHAKPTVNVLERIYHAHN